MKEAVVGTRMFMAPELVRKSHYEEAVDIWAIGVTAFYLITAGKYPFPGITKTVVDSKIQYEEPELFRLDHYSRSMVSFISACLTKSAQERPTAE